MTNVTQGSLIESDLSLAHKPAGGSVRLLTSEEVNTGTLAGSDRALGWLALLQGIGLLGGRWILARTVNYNDKGKPLYDQVVLIEDPGAVVVCLADNRVAMTENWRLVGDRLPTADPAYTKSLIAEGGLPALMERLGCWKWECPRGIAPTEQGEQSLKMFERVASTEALEEAGLTIVNTQVCGWINPNSTFFPHAQAAVRGDVVARGEACHEELEVIGKTRFFTPDQVRKMVNAGELDDGLTLAALACAGFHF